MLGSEVIGVQRSIETCRIRIGVARPLSIALYGMHAEMQSTRDPLTITACKYSDVIELNNVQYRGFYLDKPVDVLI